MEPYIKYFHYNGINSSLLCFSGLLQEPVRGAFCSVKQEGCRWGEKRTVHPSVTPHPGLYSPISRCPFGGCGRPRCPPRLRWAHTKARWAGRTAWKWRRASCLSPHPPACLFLWLRPIVSASLCPLSDRRREKEEERLDERADDRSPAPSSRLRPITTSLRRSLSLYRLCCL